VSPLERRGEAQNPQAKPAPEAQRELDAGLKLLGNRKTRDQGIHKLEALIARFPGDPAAAKAGDSLRRRGIGKEIIATLLDETTLLKRFECSTATLLEIGKRTIEELRLHY
jgi:hypothetical protein